jgi:hypothetical protein
VRRSTPPQVVIVSANQETMVDLQDYLLRAGVQTRAQRSLPELVGDSRRTVVVLFPDDFERREVARSLELLRRSGARTVIITSNPTDFDLTSSSAKDRREGTVIPKPAWGWKILDTIHELNEP